MGKAPKSKVIAGQNLTQHIPFVWLVLLYLLFDKWGTAEWVQAVCYTLWILLSILICCSWVATKSVDIFKLEGTDGKEES